MNGIQAILKPISPKEVLEEYTINLTTKVNNGKIIIK